MVVKPSYRQTEVGVIPEDWEIRAMGSIGESLIGLTYSPSNVRDFGVLVLRSSNIQSGRLAFYDNVFVEMTVPDRAIIRVNDILICVRNGSRGLIGKCALIDQETAGCAFGAFMSVYRAQAYRFIFFQFQSPIIQHQINKVLGATINQITNRDLADFKIPLPPTKAEQEAIAEVLSDADALIESQERLIAKKGHLKQGAMQELLTGKKRLPGFQINAGYKQTDVGMIPEDWETKSLQTIVDFTNGKPHEKYVKPSGRYSLITLDSIGIDGKLKDVHKHVDINESTLQRNDLVVVLSDLTHGNLLGLGDLIPEDNKYVLNQRMARLRLKIDASPEFVRLQINARQDHFKKLGQGTSQLHIYRRNIDALEILPPPPKPNKRQLPRRSPTWTTRSRRWGPSWPRPVRSSKA